MLQASTDARLRRMNALSPDPWALARERYQQAGSDAVQGLAAFDAEMRAAAAAHDWLTAVALAEAAVSLALRAGQLGVADQLVQDAGRWAQACDDARARGAVQVSRARVAYHLGDVGEAMTAVSQAWRDAQHVGDTLHRIDCLTLLGALLSDQGHEDEALQWHETALTEAESALATGLPGAHRLLARAHTNVSARLVNLGGMAREAGQHASAQQLAQRTVRHARQAYELNKALGLPGAMAIAKGNEALALAHQGEHQAALDALDEADRLRGSDHSNHGWINGRLSRVQAWMAQGDLAKAQAVLQPVLADVQSPEGLTIRPLAHRLASLIAERQGDLATALAHHKQFHQAQEQLSRAEAASRVRLLSLRLQTEQAQLEASRLRRVSQEDPLTGLTNRRGLDEALAALHRRAADLAQPLCVAVLDIDHFKQVNDTHSHAVGDQVLRRVAALLKSACRGQDIAARLGGEEFVLAFENTDLAQATLVCERLRQSLEREDWSRLAAGLSVTASFGVADVSANAKPADAQAADALARADAALYRSKREGRNRVTAAGPPPA
jgi:diguanylate cyclase (GGDEF)-like protein